MTLMFQLLRSLALVALASVAASAHEVKEMTARARVFADRVEMVITVSTHMATVLLADPKLPEAVPSPENLPKLRERLEAQARAFCALRPAGGKALAPTLVDVNMASSEELSFYLTYPAITRSPLRFEMAVLDRLEPGNAVTLDVIDAARKRLGSKELKRGDLIFEIPLPDKAKAPAPSAK